LGQGQHWAKGGARHTGKFPGKKAMPRTSKKSTRRNGWVWEVNGEHLLMEKKSGRGREQLRKQVQAADGTNQDEKKRVTKGQGV